MYIGQWKILLIILTLDLREIFDIRTISGPNLSAVCSFECFLEAFRCLKARKHTREKITNESSEWVKYCFHREKIRPIRRAMSAPN